MSVLKLGNYRVVFNEECNDRIGEIELFFVFVKLYGFRVKIERWEDYLEDSGWLIFVNINKGDQDFSFNFSIDREERFYSVQLSDVNDVPYVIYHDLESFIQSLEKVKKTIFDLIV
jgi:hypothetical protein